ncbi:MAG TPA: amidase [Rhizomicrobium sp.]|nr:amidase [Rhizomicrobium sp.]
MNDEADQDRRMFLGLAAGAAMNGALPSTAQAKPTHAAPSDIVLMDGAALSHAIRTRRVSCVEVMKAYLAQIEKLNGAVNALVALQDPSELLVQANERDAQLARGEVMGVLHGIPHAVKDLQPVKGIRTTQGSPIFKDFVPTTDSLMVSRLRNAGAIFIGKTNTPEFGLGSHTFNPVYGATRNAYDQSRSAGGSSGGAAVSLALRMVPFADGSDYGGSLRNPAGWNNVCGFRTSIGRVPSDNRDTWLPSMSVLGPMARTVKDLAMLLSVQAGYDARVPLSIDGDGKPFLRNLERPLKGKRIAWGGDLAGKTPCEPGVLEACNAALTTFTELGCHVEEAHPDYDLDSVWRAAVELRAWQQGVAALYAYYQDPAKRALLKPEAIYEIETGLKLSAGDITGASTIRTEWYQAVRGFFERYDFLILPTAQVFPFAVEMRWPDTIAGKKMETYHEWMKAALLVTMSGCPSLAVPAGFNAEGLPIGIQIIAPNRRELDCLSLGSGYEMARKWNLHLPPLLHQA